MDVRRTKHIFVSNMEGCTVRFTAVHSVHNHATDGWVVALTCSRAGVVRQHKPQLTVASVVKKRDFVPTKIIT